MRYKKDSFITIYILHPKYYYFTILPTFSCFYRIAHKMEQLSFDKHPGLKGVGAYITFI